MIQIKPATTILTGLLILGCVAGPQPVAEPDYTFILTADMRNYAGPDYDTDQYFKGACLAMDSVGAGEFMVVPGDLDPPWNVDATIKTVLGADYPWYPVIGNHEAETPEDMAWLRNWAAGEIPNLVERGPEGSELTSYAFEINNALFAVINQYSNDTLDVATDGRVSPGVLSWLDHVLASSDKPLKFVVGHEPLVSLPDWDTGRHRHKGDNLDKYPENSISFQKVLREHSVTAYLCGHTHNFSIAKLNGIWQIDAGHSRGIGDPGAPSTFLKVAVRGNELEVLTYRADEAGRNYTLTNRTKIGS